MRVLKVVTCLTALIAVPLSAQADLAFNTLFFAPIPSNGSFTYQVGEPPNTEANIEEVAQFTSALSGTVTQVSFAYRPLYAGLPSYKMAFTLYGDTAGKPGTFLGTAVATVPAFPVGPGGLPNAFALSADFSNSVALIGGSKYWLSASVPDGSGGGILLPNNANIVGLNGVRGLPFIGYVGNDLPSPWFVTNTAESLLAFQVNVTAVPEISTSLALSLGLFVLGLVARRRFGRNQAATCEGELLKS